MDDLDNMPLARLHEMLREQYEAGRVSWLEYKLCCLNYRFVQWRLGKKAMEMRPSAVNAAESLEDLM